MALCLAACGGGEEAGGPATQPATVVIAVSESRIAPAIGGTEASGVFVVVRYVLANGSDEEMRVSHEDFTMVTPDGTALRRSKPGMDAWEGSPGGYELTETVLLKPGGMPRSWVSVFDVPRGNAVGPWSLRYKGEPSVGAPAPSDE